MLLRTPPLSLESAGTVSDIADVFARRVDKFFNVLGRIPNTIGFAGYSMGTTTALEVLSRSGGPAWGGIARGGIAWGGPAWGGATCGLGGIAAGAAGLAWGGVGMAGAAMPEPMKSVFDAEPRSSAPARGPPQLPQNFDAGLFRV